MRTKDFWQGHDISTNYIVCVAWLHHAIRLNELSFSSIRVNMDVEDSKNPFVVSTPLLYSDRMVSNHLDNIGVSEPIGESMWS